MTTRPSSERWPQVTSNGAQIIPSNQVDTITLVEGTTFVVSGRDGDIDPDAPQGLFVYDARVLSRLRLAIDGHLPEHLCSFAEDPFTAVFIGRIHREAQSGSAALIVERRRYVGAGMREDVTLRNLSHAKASIELDISLAADFADLFAVKGGAPHPVGDVSVDCDGDIWRARFRHQQGRREIRVWASQAQTSSSGLRLHCTVPPRATHDVSFQFEVSMEDGPLSPRFPAGLPIEHADPVQRIADWRRTSPGFSSDSPILEAALARSDTDLAALRIFDPAHPDTPVVAAGAPWFMALFGRDALISAWMMLPVNQDLAIGTLRTLARYQGTRVHSQSEEQPGRILHELRFGTNRALALSDSERYYGSVDSTLLFVMLVGALARWGAPRAVLDELLPHVDRAMSWVDDYGDRDDDGFVEYARSDPRGLFNQGWKDSSDSISFADGRAARPPIALVEVQAYLYAAYQARRHLATLLERRPSARHWTDRAEALRASFDRAFWMSASGYYASGLDANKERIDAITSNAGHALATGIAKPERAEQVASGLMSPELFSGYGIRTLSTAMARYDPTSYHNGSVWPHDSAITVRGLMRYGFTQQAQLVASGLIDASSYFDGRLPELFCGFDRSSFPGPIPYPTSCSPQAWAAATPVSLVTSLLRVYPDLERGQISLDPALPPRWGALRAEGLIVGDSVLTVGVGADGAWEASASAGLSVRH